VFLPGIFFCVDVFPKGHYNSGKMHYLERLREKRKAAKVTQRELAAAVGVQKAHICRVENGARRASAGLIVRLALYFGDDPIGALKQSIALEGGRRGHTAKRHLPAETRAHVNASDGVQYTPHPQGAQDVR
jgi:transcriptional regulator with XRE-family HTH domain